MTRTIQFLTASLIFLASHTTFAGVITKSYGFFRITDNAIEDVANQFTVEVSGDDSTNYAEFKFSNSAIIQSSITDIYFQDGTLLGIASISNSAGVSFSQGASPGNLPGGNMLTPGFVTTAGFSLDSNSPGLMANGVNAALEWVTVGFNLRSGKTIHDTIAALDLVQSNGAASIWNDDGTYKNPNVTALRIGLHVQSIGAGSQSDGFVNGPSNDPNILQQVPEPNTMLIFGFIPMMIVTHRRGRR